MGFRNAPAVTLFLPLLRVLGKIIKWMAATVMKQLAAKAEDGLKMDMRANE